jgi:hypothetical protein
MRMTEEVFKERQLKKEELRKRNGLKAILSLYWEWSFATSTGIILLRKVNLQ